MMMPPARSSMWIFPFLLCCGLLIELTQSQGLSIIGPKKIRPNSNYTIVLSNTLNRNVRLQAVLEKVGEPKELRSNKPLTLSRRTVKQVEFNVGSISKGDYEVIIKSMENSFSFEQRVELEYEPKTMSVFLQTDKPVYNPGDMLKFRVVVVDADTRPVTSIKTVAISLDDFEGISIRKWPFARLYNGVFESAVQLSSSPPLGKWKLTVKATNDTSVTNIINVKEYVLPKFFVKAYPSRVLLAAEQKVSITVETAYTFGKPVDGSVSLELFLDDTIRKPDFTRVASITGQTTLDFDLASEVDVDGEEYFKYITAKVSVMETFTNRSINITEKIPIYRLPYTVTTLLSSPAFRPGVPYPVSLVVKDHLGKPPSMDKPSTIEVKAEFELPVDSEFQNLDVELEEGVANFVLEAPSNAQLLKITAIYDSEEYDTHIDFIHSYQSQSQQYLKVNINPKYKVAVNKIVEFDISCTETMNHLSYMVESRGNVVSSSHVPNINKRSYKLRIKMLPVMSPEATLIVFYTNKEYVIFDDCELKFEAFNNDFRFTLDEEEYTPGKDIYIGVYAAKDSYVAFSSIDQSVLLVDNNRYDFNRDDVLRELALYGATDDSEFDWFHKRGLFLRSTATVDAPVARGNMIRFGGIGSSNKQIRNPIHIRTMFQESWLWINVSMNGRHAEKELKEYAPDSITTYQVSGFALSPTLGLGVIKKPIEFMVRQPFYLVANLPYSIKRGEVALIQVTVFNFLGNTVTTDVTLFNKNDEIEFVEQSSKDPDRRSKAVIVPTNNGKPVSFMVRAKQLGQIAIKFEATSLLASDAIEHMLRVTPESRLYEVNDPRFIENTNFAKKSFDFLLNIPREIDEGSARIKFSLDPDILGTAIANLDELIRLPTGCGEQNMLHFVPNIVVLDYLSETRTAAEAVKTKAINYLSSGYQNQLKYKRSDGAFSVWGQSHAGSTFLTAFVAKSLKIAAKYINVDNSVVNSAFAWLASKQSPDGRFPEVGTVFHADMQGGLWKTTTSYALTSYVLIAFGENQEVYARYRAVAQKTAQYLMDNLANMVDVYDLSLATYAMSLIKHPNRQEFLDKLIENSIFDKNTTERYWNRIPVNVEVAGYALLSYIENDMFLDATPIMRWLNKQRYGRGGFPGTQDTFVGLKALGKFAAKMSGSRNDYRVTLYDNRRKILKKFDIDNRMAMTIQEVDIASDIRKLHVEVDGIGNGVFQIAYQYYLNIQVAKPSFELAVEMLNTTTYNVQHLNICVKYKPKEAHQLSNMALVEIFLPSGLIVEADAVKDTTGGIKKIERRYADTSVVVYYENLGSNSECFRVTAVRRFKIALHLPSYITVYDYYHRDRFAIQKYDGKVLQLCDICEDEDCETLSCGSTP
ncbi:thioester-containing protein 1 allele S3-like isoform X2 [Ochlerotatus camptorhynchus]|uniref:thioester-containing protein 1 allele S3-like isoform X2 n=1 Tax=Ochlerotatus camptorhynchus TaxID=644619 RepID=UPI0031E2FEBD